MEISNLVGKEHSALQSVQRSMLGKFDGGVWIYNKIQDVETKIEYMTWKEMS